ncbi:phthiocerol/phthiodiolone dimycocerosyl transferase family protein [Nocardia transvalensis]|uniref:phthiocerol/phthiodiolone dimycocerosyl transferase family protein n=1 Tax=Nocardia transvalensis TaxID=37333 RepID=UPI001895DE48|nr:hypothetical protein [Nocardia transvalensis]MBF6331088.1 hypothetical protein [Nocardia transvalensis]
MFDVGVVRRLAPSEEWFVRSGVYAAVAVTVRGDLNLPALTAAFEVLRQTHPVLAARLEPGDGGHLLVETAAPAAINIYDDNSGSSLSGASLDSSRSLSRVHVMRDGQRTRVELLVHHAIADARHLLALLYRLWSTYTDIVQGIAFDTVRQRYPESMEKLLADRDIYSYGPDQEPPSWLPVDDVAPGYGTQLETTVTPTVRWRADVAVTESLIEFGHQHHVTVNGLVSAALLQGEADVLAVPITEIALGYLVDLRDRLTPPVEATLGTDVLGWASFTSSSNPDAGLLELARAISTSLRASIADGMLLRAAIQTGPGNMSDAEDVRIPPRNVTVTNWGRIPPLRLPANLEIDDLYAVIYNELRSPDAAKPQPPLYWITTFSGRLSVQLTVAHPLDVESAQNRIDILRSRLLTMVGAPN